jgi:hypothetical protein
VEITRLRKLSNYLTPRFALLSLDSLTVFATWLRNVLVNVLLLFATASAGLMVPRLMIKVPEQAID